MKRTPMLFALALIAFAAPALAADSRPQMDPATEAKIKASLEEPGRTSTNKARDIYRHPLETLKFFGLRSDMAIMEIWPGAGWWTEFLAPVVLEKGRYVAAQENMSGADGAGARRLKDLQTRDPAHFGKVEFVALIPPKEVTPVKPGTIDLVLTFRNLHNWMGDGTEKAMLKAIHDSLKTGGYLGIEEHRGPADKPQDPKADSGYVREDVAIKMIEAAGFKLLARSEVNANPKDTKDYPKGVWTLPPTFTEGDKDRAKYAAIGESDRFTLLFQKM